jgi:hypothetical protein
MNMANLPIAKWSFALGAFLTVDEIRGAVKELAESHSNKFQYYEESRLDGRGKYRLGLKDLPMRHGSSDILVIPHNGKDGEWFMDGSQYTMIGVRSRRCVHDMTEPLPNVDNEPLIDLTMQLSGQLIGIFSKVGSATIR